MPENFKMDWSDPSAKGQPGFFARLMPGSTTSVISGWSYSTDMWAILPVVTFEEWEGTFSAQDDLVHRLTRMLHQARQALEVLKLQVEFEIPERLELHPLTASRAKAKIEKVRPGPFKFIRE
ncbi:MAG: hypothetical protein ACREBU_24865 [Nitrososphaera sp.]